MCNSRGFTLIELLVVVTIIVVLLALLTPAVERAIYQAELVVCETRQKAVTNGVAMYALDSRRFYPDRSLLKADPTGARGPTFCISSTTDTTYDLRPMVRSYVPVNKALQDTLSKDVDFENSKSGTVCWSDFALMFGTSYEGEKGMIRLGERWSWSQAVDSTGGTRNLVSDAQVFDWEWSIDIAGNDGVTQVAHPDADERLYEMVAQDSGSLDVPTTNTGVNGITFSSWGSSTVKTRGTVDFNFGYADGSVRRFNQVSMPIGSIGNYQAPPSMVLVPPEFKEPTGYYPSYRMLVPQD